jgi:hypothetical protein
MESNLSLSKNPEGSVIEGFASGRVTECRLFTLPTNPRLAVDFCANNPTEKKMAIEVIVLLNIDLRISFFNKFTLPITFRYQMYPTFIMYRFFSSSSFCKH